MKNFVIRWISYANKSIHLKSYPHFSVSNLVHKYSEAVDNRFFKKISFQNHCE